VADVVFYGPMQDPDLRCAILERMVEVFRTTILDQEVISVEDHLFPTLRPARGVQCSAILATGLDDRDIARLDFHEAWAYVGTHPATIMGAPWVLEDWTARWSAIAVAMARDIMALHGRAPASAIAARLGPMMVRAASRLRAVGGAATLRHAAVAQDVVVAEFRQPYAHFFAVEEYDLSWRTFDGGQSATVNRAVFISGDAVTVLPYDPVRDRVLLIEQFRVGPFARGDDQPWLLEVIAGRIDPGETPEEAARREAVEEAGIALGQMLKVAEYYPSPGAKAEYLYSYVALADLPDGSAGTFGLETEAEDIRGHLIGFDRFMELVTSGEVANAPLILTALWLQRERGRLRS
jgi:ADP-ribose pyrophosphatase